MKRPTNYGAYQCLMCKMLITWALTDQGICPKCRKRGTLRPVQRVLAGKSGVGRRAAKQVVA